MIGHPFWGYANIPFDFLVIFILPLALRHSRADPAAPSTVKPSAASNRAASAGLDGRRSTSERVDVMPDRALPC